MSILQTLIGSLIKNQLSKLGAVKMDNASTVKIVVVVFAAIGCAVSYFCYGKIHNPVEEKLEEIIKIETGVDIDDYLPADTDDTKAKQ